MSFAVLVALGNFIWFMLITLRLGGDALSGKVHNGHYFLGHKHRYIEVSPEIWHYSYVHTISMLFTHGSVFLITFLLYLTGDLRRR